MGDLGQKEPDPEQIVIIKKDCSNDCRNEIELRLFKRKT